MNTPKLYRLKRKDDLPIEFEGEIVANAGPIYMAEVFPDGGREVTGTLTLFRTFGGNWIVASYKDGTFATSVHRSKRDAIDSLGVGEEGLEIRHLLGEPLVERIA